MNSITASQLRTEGVAAIEKCLSGDCEAIITVRGEARFVVMDMQRYNYLRECELFSRSNNHQAKDIKTNQAQ
ncbi:MAG: hypothetical protein CDV28_10285 [Candidatus Electronema aureum]|uniref:Uncharacterized protein n=1 Tax=Candidatus Electronema aureum TaxID=2005002 RepID=A0A521G4P6_9BACT|nr:MAG: hypothetical protein CDV28_10285 [Candidatus Electronema aureum]